MAAIINAKSFFEKIVLDDNGNIVIVIENKINPIKKGISQYNTFKKLSLTQEGYLKTYKN
jgi:hypothetical protein